MSAQTAVTGIGRDIGGHALASVLRLPSRPGWSCVPGPLRTEQPSRCVWSAVEGRSCHAMIPRAVVANAWRAELDAGGDREDRFFLLIWQGGVWMAYGLRNGRVRGAYCPSHNSERAERSYAALRAYGDDVIDMPLAA